MHVLYLKNFVIHVACPVKGQIRTECAPNYNCHLTCNSTEPRPCLPICIIGGCVCPSGTVIHVERNECVYPNECKGILHIDNKPLPFKFVQLTSCLVRVLFTPVQTFLT